MHKNQQTTGTTVERFSSRFSVLFAYIHLCYKHIRKKPDGMKNTKANFNHQKQNLVVGETTKRKQKKKKLFIAIIIFSTQFDHSVPLSHSDNQ